MPFPRFVTAALALCLALLPASQLLARDSLPRLSTANFAQTIKAAEKPVLVMFMAKWCRYCRQQQPELERLQVDKADELDIYRVDVDEDPGIAHAYGAEVLPTMIVLYRGEVIDGVEGALFGEEFRNWIADTQKAIREQAPAE